MRAIVKNNARTLTLKQWDKLIETKGKEMFAIEFNSRNVITTIFFEVFDDIKAMYKNYEDIVDEMSKNVPLLNYLWRWVITKYGSHNLITRDNQKVVDMIKMSLFKIYSNLAMVYTNLMELKPEDILKMGLQVTETKNQLRENNSQFQSQIESEFASMMKNYENIENATVSYGNKLSVIGRLIRSGFGIDFENLAKEFAYLVYVNKQVELVWDGKVIKEFPYNDGEC